MTVELMPGDVALAQSGDHIKTLLGSCVSVILTDPRRTVGVMCHIVHVGKPNSSNAKNTAFGDVAMKEMFARLRSVGIHPAKCDAYVFGGGNMTLVNVPTPVRDTLATLNRSSSVMLEPSKVKRTQLVAIASGPATGPPIVGRSASVS